MPTRGHMLVLSACRTKSMAPPFKLWIVTISSLMLSTTSPWQASQWTIDNGQVYQSTSHVLDPALGQMIYHMYGT
ncbi:hypothetical protein BDV37DRAFT_236413 [Aspergillus pseudonomiae]|uniref:Uncharacterized protein n=1 Tax=Aspergillus pseudonomiae TaxID=1506151 RepID=A0A5N7DT60_9EURO|nr:uncharacterized protein BDV37DRAFT_236413 [Aspergillus pseudonomiae]KAE8409622.1 hypothetical protein BDV37DRAFT_236413 [Aspergillus pseudonomiae]